MNLSDSKTIITGGAGGIGSAIGIRLLESGGQVGVLDNSPDRLQALRDRLTAAGNEAAVSFHRADVTNLEQTEKAIASCVDRMNGINLLICAAGILVDGVVVGLGPGGVVRYSLDAWRRQLDVNLTGGFIAARVAAEHMILGRTRGCVILFSSISRFGRAGQTCYGATKAGVASLARSLAEDLAPYGIRAFSIAPGLTETGMALGVAEGRRAEFVQSVLLNRMGTPDEIAHLTLAAAENPYVNATTIDIHGGYLRA
jgi:NAD(P)-dependent dehydrogenase (short-subunit alcohol dehydrogenase family)